MGDSFTMSLLMLCLAVGNRIETDVGADETGAPFFIPVGVLR